MGVKVVKKVVDAVVAVAKKAAQWAVKTWNKAKKAIADAAKKAYAWTKAAVAKAGKWIKAAAKSFKDAVSKAWNAAKAFAAKAVSAMKSAWNAVKNAVKSALNAVAEWAKKLATAVLWALCKGLQWALDKVVAAAFSALAKAAVGAICFAGRMVAKALMALGSLFNLRRIAYAGSLKQAVKGNFGKLEFEIWIFGKKFELKITLDLGALWRAITNMLKGVLNRITGGMFKSHPKNPPVTPAPQKDLAPKGYGKMGPPAKVIKFKSKRV